MRIVFRPTISIHNFDSTSLDHIETPIFSSCAEAAYCDKAEIVMAGLRHRDPRRHYFGMESVADEVERNKQFKLHQGFSSIGCLAQSRPFVDIFLLGFCTSLTLNIHSFSSCLCLSACHLYARWPVCFPVCTFWFCPRTRI